MQPIISVSALLKTYKSGLIALDHVDLAIERQEIFALLGPNGAGKTTLISVICGTVGMSSGQVLVDGHDIVRDYRAARALIGLVPQEISLDIFATVWNTVSFSRGLFGCGPNPAYIERLLRDLSLWDKRDQRVIELSGGMKRRVMIAKALSHEPKILFLDEPTAGVDVNLRRDMWALVRAPAGYGRHDHPHHPLHRGGGGDGRPYRRHRAGRAPAGGGHGGAYAQVRPAPAYPCAAASARRSSSRAGALEVELDQEGQVLTYGFDANAEEHRHSGAAAPHGRARH